MFCVYMYIYYYKFVFNEYRCTVFLGDPFGITQKITTVTMAAPSSQQVRFAYFGETTMKNVTKTTTCNDVTRDLFPHPTRLYVYESVNGVEKELSGRTKLLKVWRAHGSKSDLHFVIKEAGDQKGNVSNKLKLKARLESFSRRLSRFSSTDIRRKTATKSTTSLGAMVTSPTKPDVGRLSRSSSGGNFMSGQLPERDVTARRATIAAGAISRNTTRPAPTTNKHLVGDRLTTIKLGFKNNLTSTESLRSGTSERGGGVPKARRHAIFQSDSDEYPRHSTPVTAVSSQAKSRVVVQLPSTPTAGSLSRNGGKSGYRGGKSSADDGRKTSEIMSCTPKTITSRGTSTKSSKQERSRCTCTQMCDSNNDSSFEDSYGCSQLDVAFWDPSMHSASSEHCDVSEDGFDYSFNCTFPTMADSCQAGMLGFGSDGERSDVGLTSFRGDSVFGPRELSFE